MSDEDQLMVMLDQVLAPIPKERREIMKRWVHREIVSKPIITKVTRRMWVNSFKTDEGKVVPSGYHALEWEAGKPSPSNPDALIFAMIAVDEGVQVFSFAQAKVEGSDDVGILYYHETIHKPDVAFGPVTGDALFEDFARYFATEDEIEALEGEVGDRPHSNGAAS